jgi:hypothetical protein
VKEGTWFCWWVLADVGLFVAGAGACQLLYLIGMFADLFGVGIVAMLEVKVLYQNDI